MGVLGSDRCLDARPGRRGGQRRYSDLAIETALTLRLLYHLPLRQAEGFLHALFGMMRLDLSAPDYTTLSRRSQHLRRRLRPVPPGEVLQLVLDSTGLSIVGAGEWAAAKHGGRSGKPTASGEPFDSTQFTTAHYDLPFDSRVRVRNLNNDREVELRVNDRVPVRCR